jgi:hypothetical protein
MAESRDDHVEHRAHGVRLEEGAEGAQELVRLSVASKSIERVAKAREPDDVECASREPADYLQLHRVLLPELSCPRVAELCRILRKVRDGR